MDTLIDEFIAASPKENEERMKLFQNIIHEFEKKKANLNYSKLHELISKFDDEFFNSHLSDFLRICFKFSDRQIYKQLLSVAEFDHFLNEKNVFFDSKNKISLFIMANILKNCSFKEILLFLNENLTEITVIEKKFFAIEVYMKILGKIEKKELFLNEIFPIILMAFSSAIEKYIKNKEKLDRKPEMIADKDIILNFDKYAIDLIRRMLNLCKNFNEFNDPAIKNKLFTVNDFCDFSLVKAEIIYKDPNPNLLLKHYLICFVLVIMEGVLESIISPFFEKTNLNAFLDELLKFLIDLHPNYFDYVQTYLLQTWFLKIIKRKPVNKNNLKIFDKFSQFNSLAISKILSLILSKKDRVNLIFSLKFQLKLILPVLHENIKEGDCKIELIFPLVTHLRDILQDEKAINEYKLFNFENLNIFNANLSDIIHYFYEQSGGYGSNEENRKVLLDICNVLTEMPEEKVISIFFNDSFFIFF